MSTDMVAGKAPGTLIDVLRGDDFKKKVADSLPKFLTPERFMRIAIAATHRTPDLLNCTQNSVLRCLVDLASYGLEPDGRRAHLIPFNDSKSGTKVCTLILDYKGLVELVMRSGLVSRIHCDVVCENDSFEVNLGEVLHHKIDYRRPRGKPYCVYSMVVLKDGNKSFMVMHQDEVNAIRDNSQGYKYAVAKGRPHPWKDQPEEMWKKTAFRRHSKWLVLESEKLQQVLERDEDESLDQIKDLGGIMPIPPEQRTPGMAGLATGTPIPAEPPATQQAEVVKPTRLRTKKPADALPDLDAVRNEICAIACRLADQDEARSAVVIADAVTQVMGKSWSGSVDDIPAEYVVRTRDVLKKVEDSVNYPEDLPIGG